MIYILKKETRGVLSVQGDDGYPYGMPMNHWYDEESGAIYFHCGNIGHRLDALRENNKVSFCTYDEGYCNPGHWALNVKSVIVPATGGLHGIEAAVAAGVITFRPYLTGYGMANMLTTTFRPESRMALAQLPQQRIRRISALIFSIVFFLVASDLI